MKEDIGLLTLRITFGGFMLAAHGWDKLINFSHKMGQFPDPFGFGSTLSLALVVFAEFFCAALIVLGLITRLATVPLIVTMGVAAFIIHAADPFQRKELAIIYLLGYLVIALLGPGKLSVDRFVLKKKA